MGSTTPFFGTIYLKVGNDTLLTFVTKQNIFQDTIECYNGGIGHPATGAVTFKMNGVEQAVNAGQAVQFSLLVFYQVGVGARANWLTGDYFIKATHHT